MKTTDAIPVTIPVTLLSGFLGAGKTSYLNRRLLPSLPPDSLILVNDFGSINIDAELIEYRDERIIRLNNGCICCTLGGSLAERLAELLRQPVLPASVVIEASGIANPARIADLVRLSPRLQLRDLVCLVDASQAERHSRDPRVSEVWQQQIAAATHLVINRLPADLTLPPALISRLNGHEAHIKREAGDANETTISTKGPRFTRTGAWQSFSLNPAQAIDGDQLATLFAEYADVLVRAKGIVQRQGGKQAEVVQLAGGRLSWSPALRRPAREQLVCIGTGGPRLSRLADRLRKLAGVKAGTQTTLS
ncbi:CobW family GTP-binding protein [Oceanimonas smirnovii]|uniref:CobW family GTP-binding protein n=1 Tax=Oceanimonas smirnovii TaxID=264574 RepID=UPI00376F7099